MGEREKKLVGRASSHRRRGRDESSGRELVDQGGGGYKKTTGV